MRLLFLTSSLTDCDIVLDIETCGQNNGVGRILEVGAVELLDKGTKIRKAFHIYCNLEYDTTDEMDPAAFRKHKLCVEKDERRLAVR